MACDFLGAENGDILQAETDSLLITEATNPSDCGGVGAGKFFPCGKTILEVPLV